MGDYTYSLPPGPPYDHEVRILEQQTYRKRLSAYLKGSVQIDFLLKAELLALSFLTGIEDVSTFIDFHAFTSNHTGNTILIGIGASRIDFKFTDLSYIGISLPMFILGGWILGRIGNSVGPRRRWWLIVTNILQTVLVFGAAGLRSWGTFRERSLESVQIPPNASSLLVMVLLAISSGGQVAMARSLQIAEITTANATTVYVDLFMDRNLFKRRNRARNRRIFFVLSLMVGSCVGAIAYTNVGSANTLLITAFGKAVVTVSLLFNRAAGEKEREG